MRAPASQASNELSVRRHTSICANPFISRFAGVMSYNRYALKGGGGGGRGGGGEADGGGGAGEGG